MALGDTAQMSPATVSIAIPVFNGERYLRESLASALAQTRPADEVLVMDNASTDQSREIAESLLPGAVRTAETNLGAVANFNRAVEEASGEYFAWLAADDLLAPAFLERALPALEAVPTAPACLTAIRFVDVDGRSQGEQRDPELSSADAGVRLRSLLRRPRWTEVYCLYRRSALLASPRFRDAWGADVILTWWFLLRGPLLVLDEPLLDYRVYPVKTVDMTAASLNPGAARRRWVMLGLWRALWHETRASDVDRATARRARRELLLAVVHRHWIKHLAYDVYVVGLDRPLVGRALRRLRGGSG